MYSIQVVYLMTSILIPQDMYCLIQHAVKNIFDYTVLRQMIMHNTCYNFIHIHHVYNQISVSRKCRLQTIYCTYFIIIILLHVFTFKYPVLCWEWKTETQTSRPDLWLALDQLQNCINVSFPCCIIRESHAFQTSFIKVYRLELEIHHRLGCWWSHYGIAKPFQRLKNTSVFSRLSCLSLKQVQL